MSDAAPNRELPRTAAIAGAQLRLLFGRKRSGFWIALAIVLTQIVAAGTAGILFGVRIETGHEQEAARVMWSKVDEFSDELEFPFDEGVAAISVVALAALAWGLFWPFRVWTEERPQRRGYHWAMPVGRRRHDLLRTAVGLGALIAIILLLMTVAGITIALAGHGELVARFGALFWLDLLAGPALVYLLVSIAVVGSRRPALWLWGTVGGVAALASVLQAWQLDAARRLLGGLLVGPFGLLSTIGQPVVSQIADWGAYPAARWTAAWLAWLLLAGAALVAAASRRHRST